MLPGVRIVQRHTGAEFEGTLYRERGMNEPMPDVEPEPAGLEKEGWHGGWQNYTDQDGRRRRLKDGERLCVKILRLKLHV